MTCNLIYLSPGALCWGPFFALMSIMLTPPVAQPMPFLPIIPLLVCLALSQRSMPMDYATSGGAPWIGGTGSLAREEGGSSAGTLGRGDLRRLTSS